MNHVIYTTDVEIGELFIEKIGKRFPMENVRTYVFHWKISNEFSNFENANVSIKFDTIELIGVSLKKYLSVLVPSRNFLN